MAEAQQFENFWDSWDSVYEYARLNRSQPNDESASLVSQEFPDIMMGRRIVSVPYRVRRAEAS